MDGSAEVVSVWFIVSCFAGDESEEDEGIALRFEALKELSRKARGDLEAARLRCAYLDEKISHMEQIESGDCVDDSNPLNWDDEIQCPPR